MISISCPSCGEKGNIPTQILGKRIKCQRCGKSFQAGSSTVEAPPKVAVTVGAEGSSDNAIEVSGLDTWTWSAPSTAAPAAEMSSSFVDHPREPEPIHLAATMAVPVANPVMPLPDGPRKEYKVLTQKDRWFEGKYELSRLEDALNHYARQGWVVRSMATPHVTGFSGGTREELVVLLER